MHCPRLHITKVSNYSLQKHTIPIKSVDSNGLNSIPLHDMITELASAISPCKVSSDVDYHTHMDNRPIRNEHNFILCTSNCYVHPVRSKQKSTGLLPHMKYCSNIHFPYSSYTAQTSHRSSRLPHCPEIPPGSLKQHWRLTSARLHQSA